jgi:hypothetical protein
VQAGLDGSITYYNVDTVPASSETNVMTSPVFPGNRPRAEQRHPAWLHRLSGG